MIKINKNINDISFAIKLAFFAHKEDKDIAGNNYLLHVFDVAKEGLTNEEIIVGLLHDFIKTAPTQKCVYRRKSLLHDFFGTDIYNAVLALTRHKNEERINYLKRVKDNNLAKQIKIYDIQSNLNIYHLSLLDTKTQVKLINDYNRDLSFLTDISNSSTTLCL